MLHTRTFIRSTRPQNCRTLIGLGRKRLRTAAIGPLMVILGHANDSLYRWYTLVEKTPLHLIRDCTQLKDLRLRLLEGNWDRPTRDQFVTLAFSSLNWPQHNGLTLGDGVVRYLTKIKKLYEKI